MPLLSPRARHPNWRKPRDGATNLGSPPAARLFRPGDGQAILRRADALMPRNYDPRLKRNLFAASLHPTRCGEASFFSRPPSQNADEFCNTIGAEADIRGVRRFRTTIWGAAGGVLRGDAPAFKRATDPLYRSWIDPELLCNLPNARTPRLGQSRPYAASCSWSSRFAPDGASSWKALLGLL